MKKIHLLLTELFYSVGAAFTQVVTSFVSDLLLPIISLLPFLQRNLSEKFAVLRKGPHYSEENGYNTLKQAQDDGALVLGYGYVSILRNDPF